jgi:hypothetical protein
MHKREVGLAGRGEHKTEVGVREVIVRDDVNRALPR